MIRPLVSLFLLLAAPVYAAELQVLYGGNRQGAYEPCGCPVKQLGGLGRWASAVEKYRNVSTLVVDAGNALQPMLVKDFSGKQAVATLIAKMYEPYLTAMAPANADLALGVAFLKKLPLPWVSANLSDRQSQPLFPRTIVQRVGGAKVTITGITAGPAGADYLVEDPKRALASVVKDAVADKSTHLIVLSSLGISETLTLLGKSPLPTIVVGSQTLEAPDQPRQENGVVAVETEAEGKHLGRVDFAGKGELIELDAQWENTPRFDKLLTELRKDQRGVATQMPPAAVAAKAGYVANAHRCEGCHQAQYDFWKTTQHASAYLVLFSKNQHFDPECVVCHSLAFEQPGGFDRVGLAIEPKDGKPRKTPLVEEILTKTFAKEGKKMKPLDSRVEPKRYAALKERYHAELDRWQKQGKLERVWAGVQCENCHGSRVGHPENGKPAFGKVPAATCTQCHHDPHQPDFNFEAMQPKIACPLLKKKS